MSWHSSDTKSSAGTCGPATSVSSATTADGGDNEASGYGQDPKNLVTQEELAAIVARIEKDFADSSPSAANGGDNDASGYGQDPKNLITQKELEAIVAQIERDFADPSPSAASTLQYSHVEPPPGSPGATSGSCSTGGRSESAASLATDPTDASPDEVLLKLAAIQWEHERLINNLLLSHRKDMCSIYAIEFEQIKIRTVAATETLPPAETDAAIQQLYGDSL